MSTKISWDNYVLIHDIYQKISEIQIHASFFFSRKRITPYNEFCQGAHSSTPKLFSCFMIILEFHFFLNSENNIFLKNELIIHNAFHVLFLTNHLLIPDVSCITSRLTSVYLKCFFYQFLPFISIGRGVIFHVMSYYTCLI